MVLAVTVVLAQISLSAAAPQVKSDKILAVSVVETVATSGFRRNGQ